MALDEPRKDEAPEEVDGVALIISPEVRPYISGRVLHWVHTEVSTGFVISREGGKEC